ncbi:hypothetical protein [Streptomyces pinistramenti]|nr:hypothetical protein [Streptomyces pinistramenti]MCB5906932.1 hypothetical protein [Streptomyces pinistramenti]
MVARAAQVSETTVRKGVDELEAGEGLLGRRAVRAALTPALSATRS